MTEDKIKDTEKFERGVYPSKYQIFNLNFLAFKQALVGAPLENANLESSLILEFPDYSGNLLKFKVFEAPVMEKELMDKFPSIKSYSAQGIDDTSMTLRFSVTEFGLHVMSLSGDLGTFYIDTYTKDLNNYIVYSRRDIQQARQFGCLVQDENSIVEDYGRFENVVMVNDGNLRQYRLALACTIEYSAYHLTAAGTPAGAPIATKKAVVLSAMVVSLTRLNGVYERDMAVRMNLVANNDLVIYIDSDSFTNSPDMINEIQPIVDGQIGFGNYDIGHGFCTTDSGIAQTPSVCSSGKARGITGQPNPVGDPFDIDYVAHEMGHQFGAHHTQNNACNVSTSSSYEPGSASTIMGYAGICAPNVQTNSDAYFHARSILQMTNFVTSGSASCRTLSSSGNTAPVVNAGSDYIIPNGTAFRLTGSATDVNGDNLTYCWEQYNNEITTQPPVATATTGPNFRSRNPSSSPTRYFPQFSDVLNGNLTPTWEVVPSVARTMNFALTVRDNRSGAGMTNRDNMVVNFASVGPFRVSNPTLNASYDLNSSQTITWDVAGTTGNGINTSNVNILISTDGGATFTTLVSNTLNDGMETVTMPGTAAANCRIMIEAVGNIFYAVSPNFSIGYTITTTCNTFTNSNLLTIPDGVGANANGPVATNDIVVTGVSSNISDVNILLDVTHTYPQDLVIQVVHPDDTTLSSVWARNCAGNDNFNVTLSDGSPAFTCVANMTGTFSPANPLSVFNGLNGNGTWSLYTADFYNGDVGSINSWSIEVCSETAVLTSETFESNDFVIYPNPNNGTFTIQLTATSSDVALNVHDLRGRLILTKNLKASGLVNEQISLADAQSGIYLVTIQDGSKKITKKIIVE